RPTLKPPQKCGLKQKDKTAADDGAHHGQIRQEAYERPAGIGHGVRKMRQHRGDEQKRRRIMPGEIAFVALAGDRALNRLLDVPVVGKRRMTIEYQTARRPDIDEIGWNAEAVLIEDP